ncbi:HD domain-containing protein [Saccharothrix luteola]|uniref:HD domain-containing protein n=1 Tax=Saccharothrix luteola TaxID=2893018 RepID=UPI001E611AD5|nr:HD domain-containing protein [Saccharothrix luteola]MCC8243809.1 HD domain-containing protein [Saccharothrix luteola]
MNLSRTRSLAHELLAHELPDRWRHIEGVAARAGKIAPLFSTFEADLLVSASWLHDIGYAPKVHATGFHALDGANYLRQKGWPKRICSLVAHHSCAYREAELRMYSSELAQWVDERTALRDALWWADMTTGPDGKPVDVRRRIQEIQERYGPEDLVTLFVRQAEPELVAAVERTEARLRDAGVEVR